MNCKIQGHVSKPKIEFAAQAPDENGFEAVLLAVGAHDGQKLYFGEKI